MHSLKLAVRRSLEGQAAAEAGRQSNLGRVPLLPFLLAWALGIAAVAVVMGLLYLFGSPNKDHGIFIAGAFMIGTLALPLTFEGVVRWAYRE